MKLNHRLMLTLALAVIAGGMACAFAQRPRRVESQQKGATRKPATTRIKAGGDLQAAINAAQFGDTIILEAGATYPGPIMLPFKGAGTGTDADYITIQSSAAASLPEGRRVSTQSAPLMARLLVRNHANFSYGPAAISTEARAHHYKLIGLEITSDPSASIADLLTLGDGSSAQNELSQVPHHLIVDRCLIRAGERQPAKRGIALNSSDTVVSNSYIAGFKQVGEDSQAICMWNGPGRYQIINNYLEGAAENVLIVGAINAIPGLIPSDIEIRGNTLRKPLSWKAGEAGYLGQPWTVKNLLEIKTGKRITIEGNLMENCWDAGGDGQAVVIACLANGKGAAPQIEDVMFRHNIVRHASNGVTLHGRWEDNAETHLQRVEIVNNLFDDITERWGGGYGWLFIVNHHTDAVRIEHNTGINGGAGVQSGVGGNTGFVCRNNLFHGDAFSGLGAGDAMLRRYFPGAIWARNVQIGADWSMYNSSRGNFFPPTARAVGYVDAARGNYRLAPASRFKNAATDGTDIGCDFAALEAAQSKDT